MQTFRKRRAGLSATAGLSCIFPRYLQYLLTDFRQTLVTGASRDIDELIRFWGQKVKVQGHTTRRRRTALDDSATFSS